MAVYITLLYAGILGLLLATLSFNVMHHWVRVTASGQETDQAMRRAERILSHFVEYAPLSIILLALIEMRGAPASILHGLGLMLVTGRLFHAYGSNKLPGSGLFRFVGAQMTFLVITITSLAAVYYYAFALIGQN